MNVLFLDSIERETYGGMEEWIRLVAQGLAYRDHNITVAGRPGSKYLERVNATVKNIDILELAIYAGRGRSQLLCQWLFRREPSWIRPVYMYDKRKRNTNR